MFDAASSAPPLSAFERAFAAVEAVGRSTVSDPPPPPERPLATGGVGAAGAVFAGTSVPQDTPPPPNPASSQHAATEGPDAAVGRLTARLEASKQAVAAQLGGSGNAVAESMEATLQDQRLRLCSAALRPSSDAVN